MLEEIFPSTKVRLLNIISIICYIIYLIQTVCLGIALSVLRDFMRASCSSGLQV